MVIGPQPLLVERNFLDIVFSRVGDTNTPNNMLDFTNKCMSTCPETTQLRTIGCDIDISPPVATTFMSFCNHALQLHMFRSEVYVQFSRMSFFSRMYLRFVHLTSFPSSMRKSYLLARLIFQPSGGGFFYIIFPQ